MPFDGYHTVPCAGKAGYRSPNLNFTRPRAGGIVFAYEHYTAMRKHVRRLVLSLVILSLGGVAYLIGRNAWRQQQRAIVPKELQVLPGVSQHIQDFYRVKEQGGRKVWEVRAADAQYREEDSTVVVRDAAMHLYLKDGRILGLKGDEGALHLSGREVRTVDLQGGIEVTFADYVLRTDQASYDDATDKISTRGPVEVKSPSFQVRGDRMEFDVQEQRIRLTKNVSTRIEPAALPGPTPRRGL